MANTTGTASAHQAHTSPQRSDNKALNKPLAVSAAITAGIAQVFMATQATARQPAPCSAVATTAAGR
jgi:hypothetical protein